VRAGAWGCVRGGGAAGEGGGGGGGGKRACGGESCRTDGEGPQSLLGEGGATNPLGVGGGFYPSF